MKQKLGFSLFGLLFLLCIAGIPSCSPNDPPKPKPNPTPIIPPDPNPTPNPQIITLMVEPAEEVVLNAPKDAETYTWQLTSPTGEKQTITGEKQIRFGSYTLGKHKVLLATATNKGDTPNEATIWEITVSLENAKFSPDISKVFDFVPAPGQFVNVLPKWEKGMNKDAIIKAVENRLVGKKNELVSLGAFGGYIEFGFDHMVRNLEGADLGILGNAFEHSSEPGIVMVSYDTNHNGLPDDAWYELHGSEHGNKKTIKNYEITYFKPAKDKKPEPDQANSISDATYIKWSDNQGNQGYIPKNTFHSQNYYPEWIKEDSYTLKGTKLPNNVINTKPDGTGYWYLEAYEWGYVDNKANNTPEGANFDISWARDSQGKTVALPGVHFVRVYTALNQLAGQLGETSTEITRAYDIRLEKVKATKKE